MYRLMISFVGDEEKKLFEFGVSKRFHEYFVSNSEEVCGVITKLSHLNPVVSLCQISVVSADDILKDFEAKEV